MKHLIKILFLSLLLIGTASAALRGTGSAFSATGSGTVTITYSGSAIQAGDVILLEGATNDNGGTPTITFPSGFSANFNGTTLTQIHVTPSGFATYGIVEWKYAVGGETSFTVSTSGSGPWVSAVVRIYSGRAATSAALFAVAPVTTAGGATMVAMPITLAITGITANTGDDLVVFGLASQPNNTGTFTLTPPTGFANPVLANPTSNFNPNLFTMDKVNATSGATGTIAGSLSSSVTGDKTAYGGFVISMAAAAGGSCTHAGYTSAGGTAVPNGTTGSYWGKSGAFVTPDCSSIYYWSPAVGNFVLN